MPRGLEVEITERGAATAALHLRQVGERAADPRPAFDKIGRDLQQSEAAWFATRGEGTWPPLAQQTEEFKAAQGLRSEPLVATGRLRESLVRRSAAKTTGTELRYGTDVPYARFHEYGTANMPRRPPLVPASPRIRRTMNDTVRQHVLGKDYR
jgi:phage gpG-like protein